MAVETVRSAPSLAPIFAKSALGALGIGGGSMTVPLLVWLGVSPVRAVGTSSALGIFIAFSAAAVNTLDGTRSRKKSPARTESGALPTIEAAPARPWPSVWA